MRAHRKRATSCWSGYMAPAPTRRSTSPRRRRYAGESLPAALGAAARARRRGLPTRTSGKVGPGRAAVAAARVRASSDGDARLRRHDGLAGRTAGRDVLAATVERPAGRLLRTRRRQSLSAGAAGRRDCASAYPQVTVADVYDHPRLGDRWPRFLDELDAADRQVATASGAADARAAGAGLPGDDDRCRSRRPDAGCSWVVWLALISNAVAHAGPTVPWLVALTLAGGSSAGPRIRSRHLGAWRIAVLCARMLVGYLQPGTYRARRRASTCGSGLPSGSLMPCGAENLVGAPWMRVLRAGARAARSARASTCTRLLR